MTSSYNQKGASLLVALIMLLVLTTLAISSMRGVVLDGRITANRIEQIRLENQSDSATRAAGNLIAARPSALVRCAVPAEQPCLKSDSLPTDYKLDKSLFTAYAGSGGEITQPAAGLASGWYLVPAPSGEAEGQTQNPEYGNRMRGIGTFLYEANAYAHPVDRAEDVVYTRSVFSKTFN